MREPSPASSRGSGTITKNLGFQQHAELPWSSTNVSLPHNCSEHLASETPLVRSLSNASTLMSLCADLSPSDSHFFEVLYIGKVRISQRKVPETLIDDALTKFAQHDAEKAKNFRRHSLLSSGTSLNSDSNESLERHEESKNSSYLELNKRNTEKKKINELDDDFDSFTKERVKKPQNDNNKNNLGTVTEDEEKNEEIRSCISETASSITQFCQTTIKKHDKNGNDEDSYNTFGTDVNQNLENVPDLLKTELKINEDVSEKKNREDSPSPHMNFEELPRKLRFTRNGSLPENKPFLRDRSASIGTLSIKTPISHLIGEQNRTMLFQVGRAELRLISPDRKQILLQRSFSDISSCVTGRSSREHVGFVCREGADSFACFVFRCESDRVATDLLHAVRQAFSSHAELLKKSREKSPSMTCEHCPMLWYHRLCHDIEGMNEKKSHAFILRRIEQLPLDEQESLVAKYQGGTGHLYEVSEHNAFLMMLLRAHCEAKQLRHVHDTAENRSEFLNQYLGGSTIFMKAKRSLSSGFDQLLKRKGSRDDHVLIRKAPSPLPHLASVETSSEPSEPKTPDLLSPSLNRCKSLSPAILGDGNESTTSVLPIIDDENAEKEGTPVTSPMMDIFLKVSDSRPPPPGQCNEHDATWRQAIYETVVQPTDLQGDMEPKKGKRSREELRALWKMAIEQTILLVRMENENARLRQNEESSAVRRMKLEYLELSSTGTGSGQLWDALLARSGRLDTHMLAQAVKQGVPRMSRGAVWYFLAQQASLRSAPPDVKAFPHYHTPYRTLLADLTKHHHAILIDLGRTFPKHSYFASALGPGQLALFNVLKAYSLLDPDVGYCQGLSFVAGVLLLHMEEQEAFILLRHLMFRRGLRKQYLPDMQALQVQLYQLSRLLRDHEPELHAKFEELEVSPALYAAPWILTLFTSQFPLGFVVGVFDLIFLESLDVVLSVSLALLSVHKDGLILSESCEEAAEYLKHKLPDMDSRAYNRVMKKVHSLDISRQLTEYAVEYSVLREEMPRLSALNEENSRLRTDNARMGDQLDSAMDAINNYQTSQSRLESQNKLMEQQLNLLTRYITAHHRHDLPLEIKKIVQSYTKKLSFSSKITSFTNFSTNEEEDDPRKNLKTGLSAPNLFAKISKEELLNAINREKKSPEMDSKRFLMKKSQSVHSGLIANNLRQPLKVLEEKAENKPYRRTESLKNDASLTESLKELGKKNSGFFANTHEQIRQERLFEQQLKHDFDENLRKLDTKLSPKHLGDVSSFQSRKSMSLNLTPTHDKNDSGFVTPLSPDEKKDDNCSIISHPLSDCDVDIKFDGQSTKLKQIRPVRAHTGIDAK